MDVEIPNGLAASCRTKPERADWLRAVPDRVGELQERWSFRIGPVLVGASCAWVARVTLADGAAAVLKLGMPHMEAEHEIAGLRFWDGDPTVRLLAADESRCAALIESCEPGTPLSSEPETEQDIVIARVLRRLWRVPQNPHPFRPLESLIHYWSHETLLDRERWQDSGLVREGLRQFRELASDPCEAVLLATDLHAGNILRARREPWLAIDPKPFVGDPAFDATQHLFNCPRRMRRDPHGTIARLAELLGLERERIRRWMFARLAAEPRGNWRENMWTAVAREIAP
jgi:streptomycin 6-kinase